MMTTTIELLKIYPESFRANMYSMEPFRMIGLIDVNIKYIYGIERVTLAYYRSSGTNNGKIEGLWYPIVGIKQYTGRFTEFTDYINHVLTKTTKDGWAKNGWLAKSLFFSHRNYDRSTIRGFTNGVHYRFLYGTGKALRDLYESNYFYQMESLDAETLNYILTLKEIYHGNKHTQRENYERFIDNIYNETKL